MHTFRSALYRYRRKERANLAVEPAPQEKNEAPVEDKTTQPKAAKFIDN
jgi:hypothetical protein